MVSVITDRDILLAVSANKKLEAADEIVVEDVCVLNLYVGASLAGVANQMAENSIGSVVVTRQGSLAGIFTATDACKYLASCLSGNL